MSDEKNYKTLEWMALSNKPAADFSTKDRLRFVALANQDDRVKRCRFVKNEVNACVEINMVLSFDEAYDQIMSVGKAAGLLYKSKTERTKSKVEKERKEKIINELRCINELFFEFEKITVAELKKAVVKYDMESDCVIEGIINKYKDVIKFEKQMVADKITHNDIIRIIHYYKTGRHMGDKTKVVATKVAGFFVKMFGQSGKVFSWAEYRELYSLKW